MLTTKPKLGSSTTPISTHCEAILVTARSSAASLSQEAQVTRGQLRQGCNEICCPKALNHRLQPLQSVRGAGSQGTRLWRHPGFVSTLTVSGIINRVVGYSPTHEMPAE